MNVKSLSQKKIFPCPKKILTRNLLCKKNFFFIIYRFYPQAKQKKNFFRTILMYMVFYAVLCVFSKLVRFVITLESYRFLLAFLFFCQRSALALIADSKLLEKCSKLQSAEQNSNKSFNVHLKPAKLVSSAWKYYYICMYLYTYLIVLLAKLYNSYFVRFVAVYFYLAKILSTIYIT